MENKPQVTYRYAEKPRPKLGQALKIRKLYEHELAQLVQDKFLAVLCDCGNEVFVWPRNKCECHRARCLRCKSSKAYTLEWGKDAIGWYARLYAWQTVSYAHWKDILMKGNCPRRVSVYSQRQAKRWESHDE